MSQEPIQETEQNLPAQPNHPDVDKARLFYDFLNGANFTKALDTFIANKQTDNQLSYLLTALI